MFFHFDSCQRLLFYSWTITNPGGISVIYSDYFTNMYIIIELIGSIIASFILAVVYEALKSLREWLLYVDVNRSKKKEKERIPLKVNNASDKVSLVNGQQTQSESKYEIYCLYYNVYCLICRLKTISISLGMHILQSVLHIIQVGYGYILMLIVMTYNVWLFFAVCFGAGVGYCIFAKTRHIYSVSNRESNEHCH